MARIDTYTAQRSLNPGSTPDVRLTNPVTDEIGNIGGAVQQVADVLISRQQQREDFKVENDKRRFDLEMQRDLDAQSAEMDPGGEGFHDKFMSDTFRPKRDAFLASVPERLRPKFETILADDTGAEATGWSIASATKERDENYRWQKEQIGLTQQETAVAIGMNPDAYDDYLQSGVSLIDASSLPKPEKAKLKLDWENMAQVSMLNNMLENDPSGVLRELGYDPRQLSPTTQFDLLSKAVQWQESADNPNAVSGKGAVGLMQVMPNTAREIADKLGDANFPRGENDAVVSAYLTNPYVNKRYGEYYLKEQLRAYSGTRDPIETALVAYNAGPSVAKKWVESGYDDKLLSKETRDYKANIMASLKSSPVKGDPSSVQFVGSTKGVSDDLQSRTKDAFATLGLTKVKVNSGFRDEAHNAAVGGAKGSQHLSGNAMDIDVSGMKITERIELLKALSNSGVTGIGVYANAIHVDLGGRRAWGPSHSADSIPAWAKPILAQHLNGTTPPPKAVSQRYASLPYDQRQQFTSKANQLITSNATQQARSTGVEKVEVKRQMENELALVRATGQGSSSFDATNVATILGEDDYVTFQRNYDVAQKTFTATDGIKTMAPEDMENRLIENKADAASPDFADQQRIEAAVQKEIDRVTALRAKQPDQAALEYPEVKGVYSALQDKLLNGNAEPAEVQGFVKTMLDTQAGFDVPPAARAPIPHEWAMEVGRSLSRVPDSTGKNAQDVRATVQAQYEALKQYFGDYTDEVIVYALSEYKGLNPQTAELVGGYMKAISVGGDPFRQRAVDQSVDKGQVEGFGQFRPPFMRLGVGGDYELVQPWLDAPTDTGAEAGVLSPEERLRQQDANAAGE